MNIKSKNEYKVLKELFGNPTYNFHLREIARKTNLNPNTVDTIIKNLEKQGLIVIKRRKYLKEISLNLESSKSIQRKKMFNLSEAYDSGLVDFIVKELSPKSISLIGSYSKGEDIENSDIDIIVNSNNKKKIEFSNFEKKLNRKIHLLFFPAKMSKEFFNNLINGIVVYGVIRK